LDAGLPAQRRLVNIEPRYNIAPTDFCRVKSQGVTGSIPIVSRKPSSIEKRPFPRGSCHLFSTFPVSADNNGLSGGFLAFGLCSQKFRSWRLRFEAELTRPRSAIVC